MEDIIDKYKTIASTSEGFFKEKGSKFYAFAFPINSENDIKPIQEKLRKEYYDARHHVFAWKLGVGDEHYRASDDGEPANSSGPPILGQIRSHELSDILIIVIRYFGGTKLGIPGLINAYKTAAKSAIDTNTIITRTITKRFKISFVYENMNLVMRKLKDEKLEQLNPKFELQCSLEIEVKLSDSARIFNLFNNLQNISIKDC